MKSPQVAASIKILISERIHGNPSKTVAALDLGGGSTQVTFSALTPSSLSQKEYIHQAVSPNGLIPVYTHSYLGLGLMAARKEVVTLNQPNQINVTSDCINHIIKGRKFHYGGTDYYVNGPKEKYPVSKEKETTFRVGQETPIVDFGRCSQLITEYVMSKATPPAELPTKIIFAFSYYFDRATEVGLIDESKGGNIDVKGFKTAAQEGEYLIGLKSRDYRQKLNI